MNYKLTIRLFTYPFLQFPLVWTSLCESCQKFHTVANVRSKCFV